MEACNGGFKQKMNIKIKTGFAYITNTDYLDYTKVSILSLALNINKENHIDIYIITTEYIEQSEIEDLLNIVPINVKIHLLNNNIPWLGKNPFESICFYKFYIPELVREERVLYIDSDTIVLGDISHVEEINMGQTPLGCAANDNPRWPYSKYGTGTILFQCDKYKSLKCKDKLIAEIPNVVLNADKYIINKVLAESIFELDKQYNMDPSWYISCQPKPRFAILHYWGSQKPWNCSLIGDEYWHYYENLLKK